MGLELRNRVAMELKISLPATMVWTYPNMASGPTSGGAPRSRTAKSSEDELDRMLVELMKED